MNVYELCEHCRGVITQTRKLIFVQNNHILTKVWQEYLKKKSCTLLLKSVFFFDFSKLIQSTSTYFDLNLILNIKTPRHN